MALLRLNDIDALVLCGGLGTRLQGVIGDTPKVMAQVNGAPFLDLIIEYLKGQGIERIILCTGHKADFVENYYRERDFGVTIDFSREDKPLGTGGALKNAREIISDGPFLVLNGDSLVPADLQAFLDFHRKKDALASVLVSEASLAKDFGSIEFDETDRITGFHEKSKGSGPSLVNAGIYCFDQEIFCRMPEDETFSLETDFFPELVGTKFYGYRTDKAFLDIGTPQRYELAKQELKKGKDIGN